MSEEDSIEERQENEFEVLKSIYGEDIVDLRIKSTQWQPLHLSITLFPLQGSYGLQEIYVKVCLHVICSENYPYEIPKILLEKSQGMSNNVIMELQHQLDEKAKSLKGEVMIFELAEHVKAYLHMHNKPGTKSFYEEMLIRQKQKEKLEREAQQLEKDRERLVILKEIQHRQEILKEEEIRLKREQKNLDNSNEHDVTKRRNSFTSRKYNYSSTESSDESLCEHKGTTRIEFSNNGDRKVQRGRCISHSNRNCVIFSSMDMETGEMMIITEWVINIKNNSDLSQAQKQISSLEQELNYLVKLKHQNLSHYFNLKCLFVENDSKIIVHTLREFIYGTSCSELFLCENISVEIDMLRHIVMGVLNALDFLHRNNVVHKDLSTSCVYISKKGVVKLANYSLDKRLTDLVTQSHSSSYSKKTDIYRFGILILSLLKGVKISEKNLEIPQVIPNDLYDFLTKCLAEDEKERSTAFQLLNHQFLKTSLEKGALQGDVEDIIQHKHNTPEHQALDLKIINQTSFTGQSRVESEFKVLHCVGKGAFGEVFKVQNNLDQRYYAIKRIELNPKNKQLNKKIIREVKLLSRLNHENVVRYYNSWIETASIRYGNESTITTADVSIVSPVPKIIQKKELTFKEDIELMAPPIRDVEWSISYNTKSKNEPNSSSDESSDDDDNWGLMLGNIESDSDNIEFERDDLDEVSLQSCTNEPNDNTDVTDSVSQNREYQYMLIQMEFCEKSTLRTAIDAGLYKDKDRGWRLFREIIEGLAHIHQQGMIHRDLKPVNIFLDSNDHVKIGDFGLATTNLLLRTNEAIAINKSDIDGTHDGVDMSLTGHVGTALYVAPELSSTAKAMYNHKVDIYSLGIIFFEMCYIPLNTSMERITVLTSLRSKEIVFPEDFRELCTPQQEFVIRWLLNHDVSKRPTSQELLQSEHIPPPVLEEYELRELVRNTLSNPHLKAYKYLIASCFKQPVSCAQDITFDRDPSIPNTYKHLQMYNYVKKVIVKIFKLHGGQNLATPLLMPKSDYYGNVDSCVMLMTHSGSVVSIPHDLRVPFARYVAWNGIQLLRRYSVERVYREKKIFGYIPRELYECAFDIVTPTPGNFIVDAELFYILKEIIDKLPGLRDKNILIRMNHTLLIKAILLHCGIKDKHKDIYDIFSDTREGKVSKIQIHSHLVSLGLSDNTIVSLFNLMELELPINKIVSHLQMITKKKSSEASSFAKQALHELKMIVQNIEAFGVELNIIITPGLTYNIQQYSGMMFQLVCELKKNHRRSCLDVLAAGGRYDVMITGYRNILEKANMLEKDIQQSAVGISVSLDKLVQAMIKNQTDEKPKSKMKLSHLDAIVCSIGHKPLIQEKTKVMTELWLAGIKCSLVEASTTEEIQELYSEYHVPFLITLKDTEHGTVRVQYWEKERLQDKKVNRSELIDYILQTRASSNLIIRSDSKISCNDRTEQHNHDANVNVLFVSEKLTANVRRRYEIQIKSQLENVFRKLSGDVFVLGLSVDASIIRSLASHLNFENDYQYNKSVTIVLEKYPRFTKDILEICDEISNLMSGRFKPVIILFSFNDSFYKVLL